MQKRLTIYDIKRLSEEDAPYFFSRKTLKFFGQTMRSFSVSKCADGRYHISAPLRIDGKIIGLTERFFDPTTGKLERVERQEEERSV